MGFNLILGILFAAGFIFELNQEQERRSMFLIFLTGIMAVIILDGIIQHQGGYGALLKWPL